MGVESEDWECKGEKNIRNLERREDNGIFVIVVVEDGKGEWMSDCDYTLQWVLAERRVPSAQSWSNGAVYRRDTLRESLHCLINKL